MWFDYYSIVVLIGITLLTLWKRLEERRPSFSLKIDDQCKEYLWSSVISRHDGLNFYQLETARPTLSTEMRRHLADPDTGVFTDNQHNVSYVIIA